MRTFRKTIEIKLNRGEIRDLLMVYEPPVYQAINSKHSPEKCNKAMRRLIRKLKIADRELRGKYKK